MTDSITVTRENLISAIYQSTSYDVTREHLCDGTTIYRNGDRFFMIAEEYEDDGQTFWGWTWSTGVYEADGEDREVEEYFSHDGGQDAAEPLAEAIRHLGAIEDNR